MYFLGSPPPQPAGAHERMKIATSHSGICRIVGKDAPRRAGVKRRILGSTVAKAVIQHERRATSDEYREVFSK